MVITLRSLFKQIIFKYKVFKNEKIITTHFLHWAHDHVHEGAFVYIHLETQERWLCMQGGRLVSSSSNDNVQFVLSSAKVVEPVRGGVKPVLLYTSTWGSVYEFPRQGYTCLRHGLSHEERQAALRCARIHLTQVLENKEGTFDPKDVQLLASYQTPVTVDVMLWVNGEMRGSIIHTGSSLLEALCGGVVLSARDGRFKPIAYAELEELRIEINILSDLQLPVVLTEGNGREALIQPQYGYVAKFKQYRGWYLPVIFTTKQFLSLSEFLRSLAIVKAGIPVGEYKQVTFFTFPLEIFKESVHGHGVVGMRGSLCESARSVSSVTDLKATTSLMARWLCSLVTDEGYVPRKADPYTRTTSVTDWVRMAFTAYALDVFGRGTGEKNCVEKANQIATYLRSQVPVLTTLSLYEKILTHTYLGRLAVSQGDHACAVQDIAVIERLIQQLSIPVITDLQIAALYTDLRDIDSRYGVRALATVSRVFSEWQKKCAANQEVSLAEYAELIPLLHTQRTAYEAAQDESHADKYKTLCDWYCLLQLESGAFPNTTKSNFSYTRGTGKIWEALAVGGNHQAICLKAAQYTLTLQYHAEAMGTIPSAVAHLFAGAIMHDEVNHEAWTDSVAHVLIAVTRMNAHTPLAKG